MCNTLDNAITLVRKRRVMKNLIRVSWARKRVERGKREVAGKLKKKKRKRKRKQSNVTDASPLAIVMSYQA